ncbi:MAG: CapA family protein [Muribaculaceae bacterium]|nr:CapA family protein [Muribaculaceae bacterium]
MSSLPAILLVSLLSLLFGYDSAEIVFAGDAMMHQAQIDAASRAAGQRGHYDFTGYFDSIAPYVINADYAVVNLETPVAGAPYSGYPCFNAPSGFIDALSEAGFDLFLTANNHTLDRHDRGLRATADSLDCRALRHIGTYQSATVRDSVLPFVRNINGIKVGFLNYTYGTNGITPGRDVVVDYIDKEQIRRDITRAREAGAEILAVCIHWGVEYQLHEHPSQRQFARFLEEQGVDLIIGGHPHVVQPMHLTDNGNGGKRLTVFSLGNFISNMKSRDTRGGAMVKVYLERGEDGIARVTDAEYALVFTRPAENGHNFRLVWADKCSDPRARDFARSARQLFGSSNTGICEFHPEK